MKTNKYLLFLAACCLLYSCLLKMDKDKEVMDKKLKDIESFKPAFIILPPNYDFGRIREGTMVTGSFFIKNTSEYLLVIYDIRTGCGCTVVSWDKKPIPKNDSMAVEFAFNSRNRIGRQEKTITIYTNAKDAIKYFSLAGDVIVSK